MATIDKTPETVTVIGLGAMGTALAEAFIKAGYSTTVWNRTADKADALVAKGAKRAVTVAEAVQASQVVVICVVNYAAMDEVLRPVSEALSGRTIINLTNGTPEEARRAATWAAQYSFAYLDGGIMAIPPMIGQAEALVLYSGSQDAFLANQSLLNCLGSSQYLGADAGMASLYDLALLSGMYGMFAGFLQAVALVGTEQVKATEFTSSMLIPWLNAMHTTLPSLARQIDTRDYKAEGSNLGMQSVAFSNILAASKAQGIRADLLVPLSAMIQQRVAAGHHTEEISGLIEIIRVQPEEKLLVEAARPA